MESIRRHPKRSSPATDRLLGLFSASPPTPTAALGGDLHEDEVLWSPATAAPDPDTSPKPKPTAVAPTPTPSRHPDNCVGILAALAPPRSATGSAASSASTSPSPARAIPSIPKPKPDFSLSLPSGRIYQQSAPVNVPIPRPRRTSREFDAAAYDAPDADDEDEMLPPHEIVARASARDSPITTFSVLEGAGRTLKGRDLRQVRNAVFRKTGFLD